MTEDQQLVWDTLSCNYARLAHNWGQELVQLNKPRNKRLFYAQVDKCLNTILSWPVEHRARALKTWLVVYHIPMAPKKIKCFDRFHELTGDYITDNSKYILAYERQDGI
jgi:hypothetical protein